MKIALPPALAGHWTTPEGHEMATRYATMTRADLSMPDRPDLGLANALYLVQGEIAIQTAAKERMRWLSVQLALRERQLAHARALLADAGGLIDDALTNHIYEDEDEIPDDCGYQRCTDEIDKFLAGCPAAPERVVIYLSGGLVEEIVTDTGTAAKVVVIDKDTEGTSTPEEILEHGDDRVLVSVHEPTFRAIDWEKGFLREGSEQHINPLSPPDAGDQGLGDGA